MIKTGHGSLAKPCIVLMDCEDLVLETRSGTRKFDLKFDQKALNWLNTFSGVHALLVVLIDKILDHRKDGGSTTCTNDDTFTNRSGKEQPKRTTRGGIS
jgi:hypothetical protein